MPPAQVHRRAARDRSAGLPTPFGVKHSRDDVLHCRWNQSLKLTSRAPRGKQGNNAPTARLAAYSDVMPHNRVLCERSMKRIALLFVAVIGVAVFGHRDAIPAEENSKDEGIQLGLYSDRIGHPQYDPSSPADSPVFTFEIVNRSTRAITLPANYDGEVLRLWGQAGDNPRPLLLRPRLGQKGGKTVTLAPGEHHSCFSLRLSEILADGDGNPEFAKERQWYWDWRARFSGPRSPVRRFRNEGFVSTAVFWAEFVVDNQSLRTAPVILIVKSE